MRPRAGLFSSDTTCRSNNSKIEYTSLFMMCDIYYIIEVNKNEAINIIYLWYPPTWLSTEIKMVLETKYVGFFDISSCLIARHLLQLLSRNMQLIQIYICDGTIKEQL